MKIDYSKKLIIISISVLSVVLVLDVVFANLLLGKIFDINDKVKQLEVSSQERLRELSFKDSVSSTEEERKDLEGYFIGAGNLETVAFTKYLEDLALEAGVTQNKTLTEEQMKDFGSSDIALSIHYHFVVNGKWANIFAFLRAIENLPKIGLLSNVSLALNSETTNGVTAINRTWSANLEFSVIKLKN